MPLNFSKGASRDLTHDPEKGSHRASFQGLIAWWTCMYMYHVAPCIHRYHTHASMYIYTSTIHIHVYHAVPHTYTMQYVPHIHHYHTYIPVPHTYTSTTHIQYTNRYTQKGPFESIKSGNPEIMQDVTVLHVHPWHSSHHNMIKGVKVHEVYSTWNYRSTH